ncbi:MAG: glyoxalase III HchA [Bacteroidales bacterium]
MSTELSKNPVFDGIGYEPSPYSRSLYVPLKTDYDHTVYANANQDKNKKILLVCTEEKYLPTADGKKFSTGNHPVETFVPLLHLQAAGYETDIYTPTGKPVQLEMWAMPTEDEAVTGIYHKYKPQLENPKSLERFVADQMKSDCEYIAVFIPGGHGALIGLPADENLGKVIDWVIKENKYMLSICHGPAALLSASINVAPENYPYKGYQIKSFPDGIDNQLPLIGYLPGELTWHYGEKLKALGVNILNTDITGACMTDRKLVTGDSPLAANAFGKLSAETLLGK